MASNTKRFTVDNFPLGILGYRKHTQRQTMTKQKILTGIKVTFHVTVVLTFALAAISAVVLLAIGAA